MISLIASDLDGTLLQNGAQEVPYSALLLIQELIKKGYLFAAASGRQYANLRRLFAPVADDIAYICENGAVVIYKDQVLFKGTIQRSIGNRLIQTILNHDSCEALVSGKNMCYIQPKHPDFLHLIKDIVKNQVTVVDNLLDVPEDYVKISAYRSSGVEGDYDFYNSRFGNQVHVVTSGLDWLDVMPKGVNKGSAIQILSDSLSIPLSEIMAIGDNYNDMEMLKAVGYPVSMTNGKSKIRQLTRKIIPDVEIIFREILSSYDSSFPVF